MSREVPRDKPLSEEDREYLHARGQHALADMIDQNHPGSSTPSEVTNEPVVDDDEDYEDWTVAELDDELKRRGLPTNGNKDQKVSRLRQNDAG